MLIIISADGNRPIALSTPRLVNVEVYQNQINTKYGTMMAVVYGKSEKEAGLDCQIISADKLEKIAGK